MNKTKTKKIYADDLPTRYRDMGSSIGEQTQNDWEKELDEVFFSVFGKHEICPGYFVIIPNKHYEIRKPVKDFIYSLLSTQRSELVKEIKEIKGVFCLPEDANDLLEKLNIKK